MKEIKFYNPKKEYGEFSNFSSHSIMVDNKLWPTNEHYFQAQKFHGTPYEEAIRNLESPMDAKIQGQDRNKPLRKDWESVKTNVMKKALSAKFSQHPTLRNLLIATENAYLVEHTKNDSYWGNGGNGKGQNMLGILLMELREELINSP